MTPSPPKAPAQTVEDTTTRADARRNREAVIEAAIGALAEDPNASMLDVANAAGLGRTTVYRHFESREELIAALFERVIQEAREATGAVIDAGRPVAETLLALGPVMVSIGERFRFLEAHLTIGAEALAASLETPDDPVRTFLIEAVESGELRDDAPLGWMQALMQSSAMTTSREVNGGRLDAETAGRLLGETFVAAFVR